MEKQNKTTNKNWFFHLDHKTQKSKIRDNKQIIKRIENNESSISYLSVSSIERNKKRILVQKSAEKQ